MISQQGVVFDRVEVHKHLKVSDNCPVTGQELSEFSLTSVQPLPRFLEPRTGTVSRSIPAMIRILRMEFDQRVIDNLHMRESFESARAEIADLRTRRESSEEIIKELQQEISVAQAQASELSKQLTAPASSHKRRRK